MPILRDKRLRQTGNSFFSYFLFIPSEREGQATKRRDRLTGIRRETFCVAAAKASVAGLRYFLEKVRPAKHLSCMTMCR